MAKIYFKTIGLTVFLIFFLFARLGLLSFHLPIPDSVSNFLLATLLTAIVINEKLTRGEKWLHIHYLLLLSAMLVYAVIFFIDYPSLSSILGLCDKNNSERKLPILIVELARFKYEF